MLSKREKQYFIKVVEQNQGLIMGLCKMYYAREEDRKDTFQEIALQLWKSYPNFKGRSKISTWIYKVSLNTILNKIRKEKKQILPEPLDDICDPAHYNLNDDGQQRFQRIIGYLSDLDKAILLLYLDKHSYKEMASILSLPVTNISSRINRMKVKLRKIYQSNSYEYK